MAKVDDWLTGLRGPLMVWIVALVTGGAVLLPRSGEQSTESDTRTKESTRATPSVSDEGGADLAEVRPVIQLLADATGTSLDPDAAARAAAALRRLWASPGALPDGKPGASTAPAAPTERQAGLDSDVAQLTALQVLVPLTNPAAEAPESARIDALRTLRRYKPPDDGRAADLKLHLSRLLASLDPSDDQANLELIADTAKSTQTTVSFIIATVPDYADSQVRRLFDLVASGIQQAAGALGFTLDRFYLPNAPGTTEADTPTSHERRPGAIVFRHTRRAELLTVLLVTETPTAGLHRRAFLAAGALASAWNRTQCPPPADTACKPPMLRVLGPTFSGTSQSLRLGLDRLGLDRAHRPGAAETALVITGSATAPSNCETLTKPYPSRLAVGYRTTIGTNIDVLEALGAYLGRIRVGSATGKGVALLVESNTVFGQSVKPPAVAPPAVEPPAANPPAVEHCGAPPSNSPPALKDAIRVGFPLHISRLRSLASGLGAPRLGLPRLRIDLEEPNAATDLLPSATPELTSAVADAALRTLFASLRRERVAAIGIFATDARDHLFLAREIRRELPNVLMFGTQSDLLYLNPEYEPFLRGTVIASPYPLFNQTQLQTPGISDRRARRQFALSGEQGVYNALVALVAGVAPCVQKKALGCVQPLDVKTSEPPPLLDYGAPERPCPADGCVPPVWVSVVGRHEMWPLASDTLPATAELLRLPSALAAADPHPAAFANWWVAAAFLVVIAATWFHTLGLLLAEYHRSRAPEGAHPAHEKGPASLSIAAQVVSSCARRTHWRFDAWRTLHYLPSQVAREPLDVNVPTRRTRAERCADQAYDTALLMLLATLTLVNVWFARFTVLVSDQHIASWIRAAALVLIGLTGALLTASITLAAKRLITRDWTHRKAKIVAEAIACLKDEQRAAEGLLHKPGTKRWRRWRRRPWLRNGIAWGLFAAVVLVVLVLPTLTPIAGSPSPDLAFTRVASLTSGVSPTTPLLLLASVLYLTAIWNLRRLKMHRYSLPNGWWIGELLSGDSPAFANRLRRAAIEFAPWQSTGSRIGVALPIATGIVVVIAGWRQGATVEGDAFSLWFWCGSVVAVIAMTRIAARAVSQGEVLLQALSRLAEHPIADAFGNLGSRHFKWRLTLSPHRRTDLAGVIDEVKLLAGMPNTLFDLDTDPAVRAVSAALCKREKPLPNELVPALATREWRLLLELGNVLTRRLTDGYWSPAQRLARLWPPAPDKPPPTASARAELIVAHTLTFVIRNLLARVVSSLTTALVGLLIILAAHLTYSFAGRAFWIRVDTTCLTATAILAAYTLVRFERDRVLSLLWDTDPGRINWTGGFIYRIAVTIALPLILLIASLFPEISGSVASVIEPLQKTLP